MSSIILGVSFSCRIKAWLVYAFLYVVIETTVLSKVVAISWYTSNLFSGLNGLQAVAFREQQRKLERMGGEARIIIKLEK